MNYRDAAKFFLSPSFSPFKRRQQVAGVEGSFLGLCSEEYIFSEVIY